MSPDPTPAQSNESPMPSAEEYRRLQQELKLARLKVAALETMIDIAEDELGVEIRKKSGTKPLKG